MYNQSYEDYIQNILGYPNYMEQDYRNSCCNNYNSGSSNMPNLFTQNYGMNNDSGNNWNMPNSSNQSWNMQNNYTQNNSMGGQNSDRELEDMYPEIYHIIYPMVQKACRNATMPVTRDNVDRMVNEIYTNIEGNDQIFLNINLNNNIGRANSSNRNQTQSSINSEVHNSDNVKSVNVENRNKVNSETRSNTENRSAIENREGMEETRESRQINRNLRDLIRILLIRELLGRPIRPGFRPPFPPNRPPFPPQRPGRMPFNRYYDDIFDY